MKNPEIHDVKNMPYVNINLNISDSVDYLLNVLKNKNEEERVNWSTFKNIDGQIDEIKKTLTNEVLWRNNESIVLSFLNGLIDDRKLREQYREALVEGLVYGIEKGFLNDEIVSRYLRYRYRYVSSRNFDYFDERVFTVAFSYLANIQSVADIFLTKINVSKLKSSISVSPQDEKSELNHLNILNSDLGRYYSASKTLLKKDHLNYGKVIKKEILTLVEPFRSYYIGHFIELFLEDCLKWNNSMFIGYSHHYQGLTKLLAETTKNVAQRLFASSYSDDFVVTNVAYTLSMSVVPISSQNGIEIDDQVASRVLQTLARIVEMNEFEKFPYTVPWIKWLLQFTDVTNDYITIIVRHLYKDNSTTAKTLIDVLYMVANPRGVVNNAYFLSYLTDLVNLTDQTHFELFRLVSVIINENLSSINSQIIVAIENILRVLKERSMIELATKYLELLDNRLPTKDQIRLKQVA